MNKFFYLLTFKNISFSLFLVLFVLNLNVSAQTAPAKKKIEKPKTEKVKKTASKKAVKTAPPADAATETQQVKVMPTDITDDGTPPAPAPPKETPKKSKKSK